METLRLKSLSSYGNASFEIADTKMGGERFTAFQVAGSDGKKMTEGYKINKGDEVIIYGAMYNYGGYKAETDGKGAAYIVTINGKRTDDTSGGGGSEAVPELLTRQFLKSSITSRVRLRRLLKTPTTVKANIRRLPTSTSLRTETMPIRSTSTQQSI